MYNKVNVTGKIYYVGVNDRRKSLFENLWPLPLGVSYNSYLIADEKTALLDTVEMGSAGDYAGWIDYLFNGKKLDYLIINHMEPDHSGEIGNIVRRWPEVKIVGNKKTFNMLQAFFGISDNLLEVSDGSILDLGHHKLTFHMTPWVHWPETMMTYDTTDKILFSGDAFGTFGALNGGVFDDETDATYYEGEMLRYYSNIVGKYSNMVQKALAKLSALDVKTICPVHGPVWRKDPGYVVSRYDKWSRQEGEQGVVVIYATMYGNSAVSADYIARRLAEQGVREIRVHDISKTHLSYLIRDLWKYKGVVLGTCSYNTQMFPLMKCLVHEIELYGIKNKYLGLFGSHSWNGCGVKDLASFAEAIGWEQVCPPVDIMGTPSFDRLGQCDAIATAMATRLRG